MSGDNLIYGLHAVQAILDSTPQCIIELWCDGKRQDQRIRNIIQSSNQLGIKYSNIHRRELDKKVGDVRHQGVVAMCKIPKPHQESELKEFVENIEGSALLLVLDGIQDPHNLGACLRCADAAGVHAVIVPKDGAALLTPTAIKVASGAAHLVPIFAVTNLARSLRILKDLGIWLVGADSEATQSIYDIDMCVPTALAFGAEGKGLRHLSKQHCDYLAKLPMQGSVSSLNVSVAAGIFLFEAVRQRRGG